MIEKIVGIIGLFTFILFVGFITAKVGEPDLWVVFLIVAAMAAYDFYVEVFKASDNNGK